MVEQPDPSVGENIKIVNEETLSIGREIGLFLVEGTQPVLDEGFASGDIWA